MPNLKRSELGEFFDNTKGHIFSATFVKKDESIRVMNCRKGVTYKLKGGENLAAKAHSNLVVVFDMKAKEYRMINKDTVLFVKYGHQTYKVEE